VVVVDRRPLERNLLRYLLEANSFLVPAEAGTPPDALLHVERQRPDAVVLHVNAARNAGRPLIPLIRAASPETVIVLLTSSAGTIGIEMRRGADAVLEEAIGLKDLADVIRKLRRATGGYTGPARVVPPANGGRDLQRDRHPFARRMTDRRAVWVERLRGASVAAALLIGVFLSSGSVLWRSASADELERAEITLIELVRAIEHGDGERAEGLAVELRILWEAARDAGADPQALADLGEDVQGALTPRMLEQIDDDGSSVAMILSDVVSGGVEIPALTPIPTVPATPAPPPDAAAQQGPANGTEQGSGQPDGAGPAHGTEQGSGPPGGAGPPDGAGPPGVGLPAEPPGSPSQTEPEPSPSQTQPETVAPSSPWSEVPMSGEAAVETPSSGAPQATPAPSPTWSEMPSPSPTWSEMPSPSPTLPETPSSAATRTRGPQGPADTLP
jgi:DNA-binding NarL/FixJ family response regulator